MRACHWILVDRGRASEDLRARLTSRECLNNRGISSPSRPPGLHMFGNPVTYDSRKTLARWEVNFTSNSAEDLCPGCGALVFSSASFRLQAQDLHPRGNGPQRMKRRTTETLTCLGPAVPPFLDQALSQNHASRWMSLPRLRTNNHSLESMKHSAS